MAFAGGGMMMMLGHWPPMAGQCPRHRPDLSELWALRTSLSWTSEDDDVEEKSSETHCWNAAAGPPSRPT